MHAQSRHVARLLSQAFRGYANSTAEQASSGAPSSSSMRRHLSNLAIGATGLGVAALTGAATPGYLLEPELNGAAAAYSAAVLAIRGGAMRSPLVAVPHLANVGVQLYQIGRWAVSEPIYAEGRKKTRVVVLGSGWAAATFVKNLDSKLTDDKGWYDIKVVSPRNYFVYTPLLPGAVTGTVDTRSIIESTRSLLRGKGVYHEAECLDVDAEKKVLHCRYNKPSRLLCEEHAFELPYDVLVVAVGAVNNTFNTPGVKENCFFLKEATDAMALRSRINECFELAALPGTTPEQREKLLTFCVVGGGPTGVEAAAEMHDLVVDDLLSLFPDFKNHVHIKLIETKDHILGAFDRHISEFADQHFAREGIEVVYHSRVKSVDDDGVWLQTKDSPELQKLTAGTTVWCTGIKMNPLSNAIAAAMPDGQQEHRHAIHVDQHLAVKGSGGSIFALGDAATVDQPHVLDHAEELFRQADVNGDGLLNCAEVRGLIRAARFEYPQLAEHAREFNCGDATGIEEQLEDLVNSGWSWLPAFLRSSEKREDEAVKTVKAEEKVAEETQGEHATSHFITQEQFRSQLEKVDKTLRALPATAQVANQQGRYLASVFNQHRVGLQADAAAGNGLPAAVPHFHYRHLGSFAYVGADKAVLELAMQGKEQTAFTGMLCGLAWKGMETWMQISIRNKYLVSRDWVKCKIFGRDITDA